jgi:hypothetical protein
LESLDYIGQTGVSLRRRLGMLKGGMEMPYRDPHTAGPGLWALRQIHDCQVDVSTDLQPKGIPLKRRISPFASVAR